MKGIVSFIDEKKVNTKYGEKPVFKVKLDDGTRVDFAFNKPPFSVGDEVEFDVKPGYQGRDEYVKGSAKVLGKGSGGSSGGAPRSGSGGRPFPIPPLHGDRAIIRQNALAHAIKAWCHDKGGYEIEWDDDKHIEIVAETIIKMAAHFEAYASGDIERRALEAMGASEE